MQPVYLHAHSTLSWGQGYRVLTSLALPFDMFFVLL